MVGRKSYSVNEKLRAIERIKNGEKQAKVSRDIGVAESTLRGWLKDEMKLHGFLLSVDESVGLKRKRARAPKDVDFQETVFKLFVKEPKYHPQMPVRVYL